MPNKPWINHEWLSQIIFYSIYNRFGPNGLIALRALIISGVFLLLFFLGYRKENYLIMVLLLLAVLILSEQRFMIRPGLFTLLFTAAFLFILNKYRSARYIYVLPLIQLFWVNMHGYFLTGVLIILIYSITETIKRNFRLPFEWSKKNTLSDVQYKRLLGVAFLVILASFVNPNGWKGFMYPFITLFRFTGESRIFFRYIFELKPLIAKYGLYLPSLVIPWFKIIIFVSALSFLMNFKRLDIGNLALYVIFLIIALKTNRNIAIFSIAAYVTMILNFNDIHFASIKISRFKRIEELLRGALTIILIIFMSQLVFMNLKDEYYSFEKGKFKKFCFGVGSLSYPEKAVDFIEANNIKGNVLNDFNSGAYFIWRLFPEKKVFIDGRTEMYSHWFFKEYNEIFKDEKKIEEITSRYDINCILISYVMNVEIPRRFLKSLYENKDWALVYVGNHACVFVKNIHENKAIIDRFDIKRRRPDYAFTQSDIRELKRRRVYPYAMIKKALVLEGLGLYSQALKEIEYALQIKPDNIKAYQIAASCYVGMKDYDMALASLKEALKLAPSNIANHYMTGKTYIKTGEYEKAISEFNEAFEGCKKQKGTYRPFLIELFNNMGIAYNKMGKREESRKAFLRVLELDPENETAKKHLKE